MSTSIDEKFAEAVNLKHTVLISDSTLKEFSLDQLHQVAQKILYYFPFGSVNFTNAKGLQESIDLHRNVYLEVTKADQFNLQDIPSVKLLMGKGSFYGGKQWSDVVDFLKKNAFLSMDNVYSFPERYPQASAQKGLSDKKDVSADNLMNYIDGSEAIEFKDYARFLRKKIAYFRKEKDKMVPVTWLQAVEQWASKGGNFPSDFNEKVRKLPFGIIPHSFCIRNGKSDVSFHEFVYEQTAVAFEKMMGAPLPNPHRKDLMNFMSDEQTRRDLVFYSAYPKQIDESKVTSDAREYLNLAIQFRKLPTKLQEEALGLELLKESDVEKISKILSNFPNNILYMRDISKEYSALSQEEKLRFLTFKNLPFPKNGIEKQIRKIREAEGLMRKEICQSPWGTFLVLCKLAAATENQSLLAEFITKMSKVQEFAGNRLEKDLVATCFFYDLSLGMFEEMFAVFVEERKKLIEIFTKKDSNKQIPENSRDRLEGAIANFIKHFEDSPIKKYATKLTLHVQSGLFCMIPNRITARIALGPDKGNDHCFVPFREVEGEQRMVCAGWRVDASKYLIFDVQLLHIEDFRSSGFSVPFSVLLPKNPQLFKYLSELANHHLAEHLDYSLPKIPEGFKSFQPAIEKWILKLKSHFRLAIWELATRTSFESKEGAFSLIPTENRGFTFQKGFGEIPKDLSRNIPVACGKEKPLEKQVRWSVSIKGIDLHVVFPNEWIKTDEQQEKVLNWQIAWLKALVVNSEKCIAE